MSSIDFITLWRAQPFQPFRVSTVNGTVFDIAQAQQIGISPGLRLIVVAVADNRFEILIPEQISACEVITSDMPAIAPANPATTSEDAESRQSPGGIQFLAFTGKDGRGQVQFTASDRDGNAILSTAGTRWDVHGMETFENGRSLYVHHIDDPSLLKRIIIWPPRSATLDSFAEAVTPAELAKQLEEMDAQAAANPQEPPLPKDYIKSVGTIKPYIPPSPKDLGREDEIEDSERFEVDFTEHEVGPNQWAKSPRLIDILTDVLMLDLTQTQWDASVDQDGADMVFTLRHFPDGDRELEFRTDPITGMARVNGVELPLTVLNRHLVNFELYDNWEALMATLAQAPAIAPKPRAEVLLKAPLGFSIELWPGDARSPLPFLSPRIVSPKGKAILDMRGSVWTALVEPGDSRITLELINADAEERSDVPLRIDINPTSPRVTSDSIPGSTVLAALGPAIQECRTASWMLEELQELFTRGKDIPLP
jgi:hypothetical protein